MKSKDDEKVVKKKLRDAPKLEGYYFSPERAREVRDNGQILSIRVETSLKCNLRCSYCYSAGGKALPNEIKYEEIIDVINQAKDLKAESIVIIGGGEPTIYPRFRDLVKYVHSINLIPVIFTNNQTIKLHLLKRYIWEITTPIFTICFVLIFLEVKKKCSHEARNILLLSFIYL